MDIWDLLSLLWIPCIVIGIALQIRAIYLKRILVKKYGFKFPPKFLGMVATQELKVNSRMTESQSLKKIISRFIFSKKWFYLMMVAAILIIVGPVLFRLWVTSGNSRKN